MIRALTLLVIYFSSCMLVSGQNVEGYIIDRQTGEPIEYATIYIPGSTFGTVSDTSGYFFLEIEEFPVDLVFSHLSFHALQMSIPVRPSNDLKILLTPKLIDIQDVVVEQVDMRERNIERFRKSFLGEDDWGKKAKILNEDDLIFDVSYFEDSSIHSFLSQGIDTFRVKSKAPLKISLPRLGYELYYDLVNYEEAYNSDFNNHVLSMLGYTYFLPVEPKSKFQERRFQKNRLKAYYFSPKHFTQALYDQELFQNGYVVYKKEWNDTLNSFEIKPFHFDQCECMVYSKDKASILGLKERMLNVAFYPGLSGKPLNLTQKKPNEEVAKHGKIIFISDRSDIRSDGTRPDVSILFLGGLATKRVGAMLPDNYNPTPSQ